MRSDSLKLFGQIGKFNKNRAQTRGLVALPCVTEVHHERIKNNILYPPTDIQLSNRTYTDLIWEDMACKGHFPAVTCALTERTVSHGELQEEALKLSNTFQGMSEVKTVGIILPNCIEYPMIVAGCMHAGLTVTTVNPAYTVSEIAHQLKAANADVIFACSLQQEKISEVGKAYPLKQIIYVDTEYTKTGVNDSSAVPFESFKSSTPATSQPVIGGVQLTQQNMVMQTLTIASDGELFTRAFGNYQDTTIAVLPMFHIFGMGVTMTGALWAGARQITIPRFDAALYLQCIRKYRPAFLHVVPPLVSFLANNPQVTSEDLSSLREWNEIDDIITKRGKIGMVDDKNHIGVDDIITKRRESRMINCGAAPCGSALQSSFMVKAPRVSFKEGWGMSEVTGAGTMFIRSHQKFTPGSVNQVLPNMRVRIVDPESGAVLGPNEHGELQCVGPCVMKGYFNNEKANADTFTKDGWMRTGDIGYYNENYLLFISDRMKELIKVKGMQVAPAELENVLRQLEGVQDVAVLGIEDNRAGQLPRAFIVRKSEDLTEDKVNNYMEEKLSAHKQLKGGIVFTDTIPRSAAGKILKRELIGK